MSKHIARGAYYGPLNGNHIATGGGLPHSHNPPQLYQVETHATVPDEIEKDSRCYHPPFRRSLSSQLSFPYDSRDEEKDMKRTPTTPGGNPADRPRSMGGYDPISASSYTARGPHIQPIGSGSRSNSGSSLLSSSSSGSSSLSHSSMSSELGGGGGLPQQYGGDRAMLQQYSAYDSRPRMGRGYYGSSRATATHSNPRPGYHLPPSVIGGGQSAMRYEESAGGPRSGYRDQHHHHQQQQPSFGELVYGVGGTAAPPSRYRSRVQSTGSMGMPSPPQTSHYHQPAGYASLGDRLTTTDPYSKTTQGYSQPYNASTGDSYRHEHIPESNYVRQFPLGSNYSTSHYTRQLPAEPQYTRITDEYSPYYSPYINNERDYDQDPAPYDYNYHTEPQPMSLSVSASKFEDPLTSEELGGQPLECLSAEMNSKLSLEEQKVQAHPQDGDDRLQITEHPRDVKVTLNQPATLSCKAHVSDSKEEPNFLWYKDKEPLIGEIDSDYVVEEATEKDEGVYYCLVSHPQDDMLQKTSNSAQLTVKTGKEPPEIIRQPSKEVIVSNGERLKLALEVSGEAPLSFKWYKDTRELSFATTSVLEIPSVTFTDSGTYCCTISNINGSVLSGTYNVTVATSKFNPAQKQRPSSLHNWEDQPVTDLFLKEVGMTIARQTRNLNRIALYLGLSNTDMVEIKVQFHRPEEQAFHILRKWRSTKSKRGTRSLLRTVLTQAGINLDLMMVTSGKQSHIKPNVPRPRILVHPQSKKVLYGNSFELSIQVESSHYVECQWYRNHQPLGGKIHPQIYVNSAVDSDTGDYFCVVKNEGGSVTSNTATIEVVLASSHQPPPPPPSRPSQLYARSSGPVNQPWSRVGTTTNSQLYTGLIERGLPSSLETAKQPAAVEGKLGSVHVSLLPRILEHPQSQAVSEGDPLTLSCRAEHSGQKEEEGLHYEWFFNGLSMQNENRSEYHINCFTDEDEGLYSCRVSNSNGGVKSNIAHVQIKAESD